MRAALAVLGQVPRSRFGRRLAVLGDMLELGAAARELHEALRDPILAAGVDKVYACGPHMARVYEALPEAQRGAYAATAEELAPRVLEAVRGGDAVMLKGSLASRIGPIVAALKERLAGRGGDP